MSKNYVIGFPRIGEKRELKKVLEDYWAKKVDFSEVKYVAENLRKRHWTYQKEAKIDFIASNDFSLYDNMLDRHYYFIRSNSKKISTPKRWRVIFCNGKRKSRLCSNGDDKVV